MSFSESLKFFQSIGPYTAPVCAVLLAGIVTMYRFMIKRIERLEALLEDAQVDNRELRNRRTDDLVDMVRDYKDSALANRLALERLTVAIQGVSRE